MKTAGFAIAAAIFFVFGTDGGDAVMGGMAWIMACLGFFLEGEQKP